ncbi:MAG: ATP-binding protein [Candidatus Omnitrophica bacterium]|nr:ATP-binding protein [Candidatus Omnitrophota bacterium]
MHNFKAINDLRIGKIIEVNGTSIKVELDSKLTDLTRSFNGRVYSIGQMATIIKIHFGKKVLFAYVRMLRMRSEIAMEMGQNDISPSDDSRILEADLFGQGIWDSKNELLDFNRGVETYPLPLQAAYLMTNEELECLYKGAEESFAEKQTSPIVSIGTYVGGNQKCRANINKLFGHHCAVLGSTGSGKSGTVAAIIHSILEHKTNDEKLLNPRIIIIDPHGEYAKPFSKRGIIYKAYSEASSSEEKCAELIMPYWLMTGDEFRSLVIGKTEYEATSQNNIVYEALAYARMVEAGIIKSVGDDPNGSVVSDLCDGKQEEDRLNFDRDKPIPFKLKEFINHIDKVQGRKKDQKNNLAPSDSMRQKIEGILKKLRVLQTNPQLNFLFEEYSSTTPAIASIIAQFIGLKGDLKDNNIRIIDISGLPNEVAGLLTAIIARILFQYKLWQNKKERKKDPLLLICEEAHRYVPNHGEAQYKEAQSAIRRIAKEGRKYGIGLMLVSQRPSDVESTVLSQCNSWIILRLTNSNDQNHVSSFLPDSLSGLIRILPSLTRREAVFVGEAAALPSRIRIRMLEKEQLPDSEDIDFVEGWSNELLSDKDIEEVTNKWTKI